MPRGPSCPVCAHPQRADIERMLVEGQTQVRTGEQFGLPVIALYRHISGGHAERDARMGIESAPDAPSTATRARRSPAPADIVRYCQVWAVRAMEQEGVSMRDKVSIVRELLRTADLQVRAAAVAQGSGDRSEAERREQALRSALLRALAPFPDAHGAVLAALDELDADPVEALVEGQE